MKENEKENENEKINQLIVELSESREDERNTQNQILQIISIMGTVLGLLFGASYLSDKSDKNIEFKNLAFLSQKYFFNFQPIIITPARVIFWLSALSFLVAFFYITYLGIENTLRYYHIKNIEERLYILIPEVKDNDNRGAFLHWNEFIAPIMTKNPKHIASSHTALSFFTYIGAIICIIIFSMSIVISLFFVIEPILWYDKLFLITIICFMLLAFYLFLRLTRHSEQVAQFAWDVAHKNKKLIIEGKKDRRYSKSESFSYYLKYFIYPKLQDLQKPLLIIIGFCYGVFYLGTKITFWELGKLFLFMFIFDFLAYQARYQINDIRGIKEDKEANCHNRLFSMAIKDESRIIALSLKIALFKIILSLFFTLIIQDNSKYIMLSFLCGLLLSTVVYEFSRSKNIKYLIFLTVGTGYPLRFFLGFFAIVPVNLSFGFPIICIILSFLAFGSFSSIISWTNEVTDRIQEKNSGIEKRGDYTFIRSFEKQHYIYLQDKIKQRYILASNHPYGEKIIPLREKGNLYDPWNVLFLFSMVMLSLAIGFHISCKYIILEIIFNLLCIINIYAKRIFKLIFFILLWIMMIVKFMLNISMIVYVLISGLQMLIISTYFVLCYRPQIKKIDLHILIKKAKNLVLVLIIGENAAKMLKK